MSTTPNALVATQRHWHRFLRTSTFDLVYSQHTKFEIVASHEPFTTVSSLPTVDRPALWLLTVTSAMAILAVYWYRPGAPSCPDAATKTRYTVVKRGTATHRSNVSLTKHGVHVTLVVSMLTTKHPINQSINQFSASHNQHQSRGCIGTHFFHSPCVCARCWGQHNGSVRYDRAVVVALQLHHSGTGGLVGERATCVMSNG